MRRCALLFFLVWCVRATRADAQQVTIDSPQNDQVITSPAIYVTGTAVSASRNIGVIVNDAVAHLDLDHAGTKSDPFRWFVEVYASPGTVKLKARVQTPLSTDVAGDESAASVRHVQFAPISTSLQLKAFPSSGLGPLPVQFHLVTDPALAISRAEIDYDGNGTPEVIATGAVGELYQTYATPGLWVAKARLTFGNGATATISTAINVQTLSTMDSLLRAVWQGFTAELRVKNVDGALRWLASDDVREKYASRLNLVRDGLPMFVDGIQSIDPVWIHDGVAHYLARRTENGRTFGYHLYLGRDAQGLWKIIQF